MNVNFRNFAIWLVILFMLMGLFQVFQSSTRSISVSDKSYSEFVADVDAGRVSSVTITDNVVTGTLREGSRFETVLPAGARSGRSCCRAGCPSWLSSASGSSSSARCRAVDAAAPWALASRAPSC
jgi:hypothetical protein